MSYPVLYPGTEAEFVTNGIGILSDAVSCTVTEERNGSFELEMQYPVTGVHFDAISLRSIVLVKPNPMDRAQPFRVYRITRPLTGIVTVYAEHISYDLSGVAVGPFTAGSAADALVSLKANAVVSCPFAFWTDKSTAATMTVTAPASLRSLLGGAQGSVLDVYGGEFKFDRFQVLLYGSRGADRGVSIRYGKNLTDLKQEENCSNVYTGVCPYWQGTEGSLVQLPEKIVNAAGSYDFTRILPLDFSSEWQDAPTEEQLRARAEAYIKANVIGVPKVSLDVSFVQLEQAEEYKDLALFERVELCDTVSVEFPAMGVSAMAKVVATVYNVLLDRYDKVSIGDARHTLADTIAEQQKAIQEKPSVTWMQSAILTLTANILGAKGGAVRLLDKDGDGMPDELYIADNADPMQAVRVWRWNYMGWGVSRTGYNGPFVMGATLEDGLLAEAVTAARLVAGTIQSADDGETVFIDLDNGIFRANLTSLTLNSKTVETVEGAINKANNAQAAAEQNAAADATSKAGAALEAALQGANSYTDDALTGYTTTADMQSLIEQTAGSITSTVEATYTTKAETEQVAEDAAVDATVKANAAREAAAADATAKANAAEQAANDATDEKLRNYTNTVTMRSEIRQTVEEIRLSVENGETSSTLKLMAGETELDSAEIMLSGLVRMTSLENGETVVNGSCVKTGTIESEDGTTRYDLDHGNIQMGADDAAHVYMDNKMINWYVTLPDGGVGLTGIMYSVYGYTWIGARSRYTYFGWIGGDEKTELPVAGNASHWRGMGVDNQDSRVWFNTDKVDVETGDLGVTGRVAAKTLYVHGAEAGEDTDLQEVKIHGTLGCDQGINCRTLYAWDGKDRAVPTAYGTLGIEAMESPAPAFCDFGGGACDEDGVCYAALDERYLAVTEPGQRRRWILTDTCGAGALWAEDRPEGAVVHGKPGQTFDWLCIAAQKGKGGEYANLCETRPPWLDPPTPDVLTDALESVRRDGNQIEYLLNEEELIA